MSSEEGNDGDAKSCENVCCKGTEGESRRDRVELLREGVTEDGSKGSEDYGEGCARTVGRGTENEQE